MSEPFLLRCAWCDFGTRDAGEMVTHMITSLHGMSAEIAADMKDGGGMAEFTSELAALQADPEGLGEPVTEEDMDDMPEELREKIERRLGELRAEDRKKVEEQ